MFVRRIRMAYLVRLKRDIIKLFLKNLTALRPSSSDGGSAKEHDEVAIPLILPKLLKQKVQKSVEMLEMLIQIPPRKFDVLELDLPADMGPLRQGGLKGDTLIS
jgi:hypothetical protein